MMPFEYQIYQLSYYLLLYANMKPNVGLLLLLVCLLVFFFLLNSHFIISLDVFYGICAGAQCAGIYAAAAAAMN